MILNRESERHYEKNTYRNIKFQETRKITGVNFLYGKQKISEKLEILNYKNNVDQNIRENNEWEKTMISENDGIRGVLQERPLIGISQTELQL